MNGSFIVIEGSDGSGKTTQYRLLSERLRAVGYDVVTFDFPRYDEPSGYFVRQYLNGEYGPAAQINPYTSSLFFALDRFAAAKSIQQALSEGKVVLSNRYTGSNMAHQGSKFASEAEQRGFFVWADSLEFQLLGIPRPNLNIFLRVPAEISYKLISKRAKRSYTDKARDEHEADPGHLKKSVNAYDLLCRLFPKDYIAIDCTQDGQIADIATINDRIWQIVTPYLPAGSRRHKPRSKVVQLFEPPASPEPTASVDIQTAQPVGKGQVAMILKPISQLAVLMIQKNGVETRSMKTNQTKPRKKDFYKPSLIPNLDKLYSDTIGDMELKRQQLLAGLSKHLKNPQKAADLELVEKQLQPLASTTSAVVQATKDDFINLAHSLNQLELDEFTTLAAKLARRVSVDVKDGKKRPISTQVSDRLLPQSHSTDTESVILAFSQPRLEFDLLNDILFDQAQLSHDEIIRQITEWDYQSKAKLLDTKLAEPVGTVAGRLKSLCYFWDLIIDKPSLEKLIDLQVFELIDAQWPTPRFGYDVPDNVETAGLTDLYVDIFDQSLALNSKLHDRGFIREAGYAVLAGFRLRCRVATNYRQLAQLRAIKDNQALSPSIRNTVGQMFEILNQLHPHIARSLISRPGASDYRSAAMDKHSVKAGRTKAGTSSKVSKASRRRASKKK